MLPLAYALLLPLLAHKPGHSDPPPSETPPSQECATAPSPPSPLWPSLGTDQEFGFSPSSSMAYFFLRDEVGVDEDDLLRILLTCDAALCLSVDSNLRPKMAMLQQELGCSLEELARCVGRCPVILTKNQDTLRKIIAWFREELLMTKDQVRRLVGRLPASLTYALEEGLVRKFAFYKEELGLTRATFRAIITANPSVLGLNVEENVAGKVAFFQDDLFLSRDDLHGLVRRCPRLLSFSLENKLEPTATFLMEKLGTDPLDLGRMVLRCPGILLLDEERKLKPLLEWIGPSGLGCDTAETRRIMRRCPSLALRSLNNGLRRNADFLCEALSLDDSIGGADLRGLVAKYPQALTLSAAHVGAVLSAVREETGIEAAPEVRRCFTAQPSLLGFRPATLREKLRALKDGAARCAGAEDLASAAQGESAEEAAKRAAKELVLRRPTLLGLSLEGRLKPRMEALAEFEKPFAIIATVAMWPPHKYEKWLGSQRAQLRGAT